MNPANTNLFTNVLLTSAAHDAYRNGRERDAAKYYAESVERSQESRNVAAEMEAKRWQGNSLMWSARHEEALQLLLEVATCDHPEANPASVFGAKTDCIMLSLFHARASACRALIDDSAQYLAVIGKSHWRHRLDLLTCMLLMRQGRFAEAADAIAPAYRRLQAAMDGPRYTDFAYFKWSARPAFFLRQDETLAHWENIADKTPFTMFSDRLRLSCIRLLRARLRRIKGVESPELLEEAQRAAKFALDSQFMWDEIFDIARALMLAGDMDTIERMTINQITLYPFERACLEMELKINALRRKLQLAPWDTELNWPIDMPETFASNANIQISSSEANELNLAAQRLAMAANIEDERLETTKCGEAAQIRSLHAKTLLQTVTVKSD